MAITVRLMVEEDLAQGLTLVDRSVAMVRGRPWRSVRAAPRSFALVTQAMG